MTFRLGKAQSNIRMPVDGDMINGAGAAAAKSRQSCPTLCDPTEGSPPGSPIPVILKARICTLEYDIYLSLSDSLDSV